MFDKRAKICTYPSMHADKLNAIKKLELIFKVENLILTIEQAEIISARIIQSGQQHISNI
jgi:hypothetical protein